MDIKDWFKRNYWLTIIMLAAAAMRIYHLDHQSLWLDEVLTMNDVNPKLSYKQFYESVLFWESFPHLYFLLLKYYVLVFGYTTLAARFFSAVIGIFGVYGMFLLGRELYNKRVGLIAASLAAVNIFQLSHSQEVRPYGLFFLLTVLSFYRFVLLIKRPGYRNALYYAVFTALMVNTHFFAFLTVAAQMLLLLFFWTKTERGNKLRFFRYAAAGGLSLLVMSLPIREAFMKLGEIESFWVPRPTPDSFSVMFREFFGNSEIILTIGFLVVLHFVLTVFKRETPRLSYQALIDDKLIFSSVVFLAWFVVWLVIPMVKSYTGISVILIRYFIGLLPALMLLIAVGVELIRNKSAKAIVLSCLLSASLLDIFVVKDYYNAPSKTQLRELTQDIKSKNVDNAKIVVHWGWIFPYFFQDRPATVFEQKSLGDYIESIKGKKDPQVAFWYADANSRPFALTPDQQAYLDQNFNLVEKLEYFDAWANYYVPKGQIGPPLGQSIDLHQFSPANFSEEGSLLMFSNGSIKTGFFAAPKGNYSLTLHGRSLPEKPLDGQNAHLKIKMNGAVIGEFFLVENPAGADHTFSFSLAEDQQVRFQIIYDNDAQVGDQDRNVEIHSVRVERK